MMMWNDSWSTGQWLWMSLMMVLVVAVAVALTVWVVRELGTARSRGATSQTPPTPEEILAERFARGEIDEEEFTRRTGLLHQPRP